MERGAEEGEAAGTRTGCSLTWPSGFISFMCLPGSSVKEVYRHSATASSVWSSTANACFLLSGKVVCDGFARDSVYGASPPLSETGSHITKVGLTLMA